VKEIEESNDWVCYRCNTHPIREHRALCWGLRTFLKEQRSVIVLCCSHFASVKFLSGSSFCFVGILYMDLVACVM
jgi:hypothetical protein